MESEPCTSASIVQIMAPEDDSEDTVIEELRRVPIEQEETSSDQLHHESTDDVDNLMPQGSVGSHHSQQSTSHEPTPIQLNCSKKNAAPAVKKLLDQERFLPIANVVRLMKRQMDPNAKLAKDAKECVQECTSEFISFIAAEAADMCGQQKRKTILADDLLTAMESLGFDNYAEPMRVFLQKYRQVHKITGPYHHEHPHYRRPPQFENDPPVAPLFFTSDNGERRSTETKYVINKTEFIKNAPLDDEWNEETGEHTGNLVELAQRDDMNDENLLYDETTMDGVHLDETEVIDGEEDADDNPLGAIALEPHQMQIYYDSKTNQHFAAKETPNGMELYPLVIDNNPLLLETVDTEPNQFVESAGDDDEHQSFAEDEAQMNPNQPSSSSAIYRDGSQPHASHQYYQQDQYHQMSSALQRHQNQNQNHRSQPKRRRMVAQEYDEVHDDYASQNPDGEEEHVEGEEEEEEHLQPLEDSAPGHHSPIPTLNSLAKPPRTPRPVPPHRAVMATTPRPPSAGKRTPQKRKK